MPWSYPRANYGTLVRNFFNITEFLFWVICAKFPERWLAHVIVYWVWSVTFLKSNNFNLGFQIRKMFCQFVHYQVILETNMLAHHLVTFLRESQFFRSNVKISEVDSRSACLVCSNSWKCSEINSVVYVQVRFRNLRLRLLLTNTIHSHKWERALTHRRKLFFSLSTC